MHQPISDTLVIKKHFFTNTSVRATLNPRIDLELSPNILHVPVNHKKKSISTINTKNNQVVSATALPHHHFLQQPSNQRNTRLLNKNNFHIISPQNQGYNTWSLTKPSRTKQCSMDQCEQQRKKMTKASSHDHQGLFNSQSSYIKGIKKNSLRQTTCPNTAEYISRQKHEEWNHILNHKNMQMKIARPIIMDKISENDFEEQRKSPKNNPFRQNLNNYTSEGRLLIRQTLDPQIERNFLQSKSPMNRKKILDNHEKQISPFKKQINHSGSHGTFWKTKACTPPSGKPSNIEKKQENSSQVMVPLLHLPTNQKPPGHKPSFFLSKKSLNRFHIAKQLGTGAFSDSFLCTDKKSNAIFCLKRFHKATLKNFPNVLENFIKKVAFQFLADHPNIIQAYDIFADFQFVYIVQEYMEGGTLYDLIHKKAQKNEEKAATREKMQRKDNEEVQSKIIDKIFDINSALCYIHQSCETISKFNSSKLPPLSHGDIRSKSILTSMGVCKLPTIQLLQQKSAQSLDVYSPPELIFKQVYIQKSDIWNLGLILFELCSERTLIGNNKLSTEYTNSVLEVNHNIVFNVNIAGEIQKLVHTTQILKDLIKRLLSIKLEDRPSSSQVIESNVFRVYGYDIEWKQRENQRNSYKQKSSHRLSSHSNEQKYAEDHIQHQNTKISKKLAESKSNSVYTMKKMAKNMNQQNTHNLISNTNTNSNTNDNLNLNSSTKLSQKKLNLQSSLKLNNDQTQNINISKELKNNNSHMHIQAPMDHNSNQQSSKTKASSNSNRNGPSNSTTQQNICIGDVQVSALEMRSKPGVEHDHKHPIFCKNSTFK